MSSPNVRLWSLPLIGAVTVLTTFSAGILLASINWRRMGLQHKANKWLIGGLIAVALYAVLIVFVPSAIALQIHLIANVVAFFALQREMKPDLQAFQASNPTLPSAHWLSGCAIALFVSIVLAAAILSITIVLSLMGVPLPE